MVEHQLAAYAAGFEPGVGRADFGKGKDLLDVRADEDEMQAREFEEGLGQGLGLFLDVDRGQAAALGQ